MLGLVCTPAHVAISRTLTSCVGKSATILDASDEFIERIFKVNLVSQFILIKQFLPAMLEARKGHIVTIGSVTSFVSVPNIVHYSCTKTAVNFLNDGMMTDQNFVLSTDAVILGLRSELLARYKNGHTIRTTSVHPEFHDTPMIQQFRTSLNRSGLKLYPAENVSTKVVEQVLQGRSGKLYMPERSAYHLSFIKALPTWFFDLIAGHIKESRTGSRIGT